MHSMEEVGDSVWSSCCKIEWSWSLIYEKAPVKFVGEKGNKKRWKWKRESNKAFQPILPDDKDLSLLWVLP